MARHKTATCYRGVRLYWTFSDEVATADGLLFKGTRLVIPGYET